MAKGNSRTESLAGNATERSTPSLREVRREQRIAVSREQILDAAEELFAANGFKNTGLDKVTRASEFSVGSVYTFFDSKHDLLEAVMNRRGDDELEQLRACLAGDMPGDEIVLSMVRNIIELHQLYPSFGRLSAWLFTPGFDVVPDIASFRERRDEALDMFATAIERGQQAKRIRRGSPRGLACLVSALISTHHLLDAKLTATPSGVMTVDELLEIVAGALSLSAPVEK